MDRYILRVRLVRLSNRTLRHPYGLRARASGGRGAGTRATPGTPERREGQNNVAGFIYAAMSRLKARRLARS